MCRDPLNSEGHIPGVCHAQMGSVACVRMLESPATDGNYTNIPGALATRLMYTLEPYPHHYVVYDIDCSNAVK